MLLQTVFKSSQPFLNTVKYYNIIMRRCHSSYTCSEYNTYSDPKFLREYHTSKKVDCAQKQVFCSTAFLRRSLIVEVYTSVSPMVYYKLIFSSRTYDDCIPIYYSGNANIIQAVLFLHKSKYRMRQPLV